MSLKARLAEEIAAEGPMRVDAYVLRCLWDPRDGYYATRPALGAEGDFLTAPNVSQMFGELLGLWAVQVWLDLGRPTPFTLAEIGAGDGALMANALRAARVWPDFIAAAELRLIEPSAPLRARQAARLAEAPLTPAWIDGAAALPVDRPMIVLANEVLDCLPARQMVRTAGGWAERRIGLDERGELAFVHAPAPAGFVPPAFFVEPGQVVEVSAAQEGFAADLAMQIVEADGAALLIDYGRDEPGPGDTLQALRGHARRDPLASPGADDLTVWADFPAVAGAARATGAAAHGPTAQGHFLCRLGLEVRLAALAAAAPELAATLRRQADRLAAPDQMGRLFKAVAFTRPDRLSPPGFGEAAG